MARILIVDDEQNILTTLRSALERRSHEVATAATVAAAKGQIESGFDLIFLDVMLPDGNGLELARQVVADSPQQIVVMISGHADVEMAVDAIRFGAFDFIEKPISLDRVLVTIDNATRTNNLRRQRERLSSLVYPEFIGQAPSIQNLREQVVTAATRASRFLITGENGTGKELVAHMIHNQSQWSDGPFVAVNCAALPSELVESELFGHTAGAFTGAGKARTGHFVEADRGTIFLDEISEMPPAMQAKILRAIETRTVLPLGTSKTIEIEGNVVAASNRNLTVEVDQGRFRQDLLYRLNVVQFDLPSLRQRVVDIPLLMEHFLSRFGDETKQPPRRLNRAAMDLLMGYSFPGNVRELRNLAERINIYCESVEVSSQQIKTWLPSGLAEQATGLRDATDDFQRGLIGATISRYQGNITRAARELGLERSHLYKKMKKLGLQK